MLIFVTGGAGYVGSHCVKSLCESGHEVVVYDNLSLGHRDAVHRDARLIEGELSGAEAVRSALRSASFDAVMHFAAFANVGESVADPLKYYRNNLGNTQILLEALSQAGVRRLVFSSTCSIYGTPDRMPITETTTQQPINPYGRSKLAVEWMLADSARAWGLGSCSLRYFNASGAAKGGTIGEDHEPETHLIPLVLKTALKQRSHISIFGDDYETQDGTCVRDYIHVEDLASAHRLALETIQDGTATAYNVGTGQGHSVKEVVQVAGRVTGREIPVEVGPRRPGDPPVLIADASQIREALGWQPQWTSIEDTISSAWAWHESHPTGFQDR